MLLIFKRGFPGRRFAASLDGMIITELLIFFHLIYAINFYYLNKYFLLTNDISSLRFLQKFMNSFEINKIIAAIILTIVVIVGIDKLADAVYRVEVSNTATYKVASNTKKNDINTDTKTASSTDIKSLLAIGNIDHGKVIFKKCAACHSIKKGGGNRIGPALWGVIGRQSGSIDDFKYSKAMLGFGKTWNFETMNAFLIKPKEYVKGTKMAYAGLKNEKDRASIIIYLNEQGDSPLPLP